MSRLRLIFMIKSIHIPEGMFLFRGSSMVEQVAVNDKVLGSSPSRGALFIYPTCVLILTKTPYAVY